MQLNAVFSTAIFLFEQPQAMSGIEAINAKNKYNLNFIIILF